MKQHDAKELHRVATKAEWPALVASARIAALARRVLQLSERSGLRIATADACTGGLLALLLSDSGAQKDVFECEFVALADPAVHELLGVPPGFLSAAGAVSETAARLMADEALARSGANIALSMTGWPEQGPNPRDEVGMVWFGCARRGEPTWTRLAQFGAIGRGPICRGCLGIALEMALGALHD